MVIVRSFQVLSTLLWKKFTRREEKNEGEAHLYLLSASISAQRENTGSFGLSYLFSFFDESYLLMCVSESERFKAQI